MGVRGASILLEPEGVRIPGGLSTLGDFRAWSRSEEFPERGRIDWIAGEVVVDMSPEDVNTHGTPKAAIARGLAEVVEDGERGVVLVDRTRVSLPSADLSVEPDVVIVLFSSVESRRVRLVPKATGEEGRYVEIEGPPDLVVECVSDSSVSKDRERLLAAYHRAGVTEYWLVDARGTEAVLLLHRYAPAAYEQVSIGSDGCFPSAVLGARVRLVRLPARAGLVRYRLEHVSG